MNINRLVARASSSSWKRFSNRHKGESCYIFGNGPSIKWFDLNQFMEKPVISTGQLHYHNNFHKLNVKYLALVEPWFFVSTMGRRLCGVSKEHSNRLKDQRYIAEDYKNHIRQSPDKNYFLSLSNYLSLSGKNINYVYRGFPEIRNRTDQLLSQFDLFSGSFYASLSLAYYLGFTEIYLVGFDAWTIQPPRNIRYYEFGEGEFSDNVPGSDELLEIFKQVIDIYTISADGQSSNVENINYEKYTGTPAVYKENSEIIDDHYLKMLSLCPGYKIYPNSL